VAEGGDNVLRLLVGQKTGTFPVEQLEANPEGVLEVLTRLSLADVCAATFLWNLYESALRETRVGATPASVARVLRKHANRRVFRRMAREIAHAILHDPEVGTRFAEVREKYLPLLYDALANAVEAMDREVAERRVLAGHPFVRKISSLLDAGTSEPEDTPCP